MQIHEIVTLLSYVAFPAAAQFLVGALEAKKSKLDPLAFLDRTRGMTFVMAREHLREQDPHGAFCVWATQLYTPDFLGYWLWPLWLWRVIPLLQEHLAYVLGDMGPEGRPEWMNSAEAHHIEGLPVPVDLFGLPIDAEFLDPDPLSTDSDDDAVKDKDDDTRRTQRGA